MALMSRMLRTSSVPLFSYRWFSEDGITRAAGASANKTPTTVFSRILNKELPADIAYEDDKVDSL